MNELQTIKKFFPKSNNIILDLLNNAKAENSAFGLNISNERDIELEKYISNTIRNLNLELKLVKENDPNAFTIPLTIDQDYEKKLNLFNTPILSSIFFITNVYRKLLNARIDATVSSGIISFTHNLPPNFILASYQTTGLLKILKNDVESRFAIILHEIGHWHSVHPYLVTSLDSLFTSFLVINQWLFHFVNNDYFLDVSFEIFLIIIISMFLFTNYIKSINESNCDKFAKKLGYGDQLANALFKMENPRTKFNDTKKDEIIKLNSGFISKIKSFTNKLLTGYPHTNSRIENSINEGIFDLISEITLTNLTFDIDNFFSKAFLNKIN